MTDVKLEPHRTLLLAALEEATRDDAVVGLLLTGSLARGDWLPGTDLDLVVILAEGFRRPFQRQLEGGILVERASLDAASATRQLTTRPMQIFAYLDGRILYDAEKTLERLTLHARDRLEAYETPAPLREEAAFLLRCSRDKMRVALAGGDLLKAAYVAGTSSWNMIEGLWAANDLPVPPNSSVRAHLRDLTKRPPDIGRSYRELFLADASRRVQVALELIDWILMELDGSDWWALTPGWAATPRHRRKVAAPNRASIGRGR